MMYYLVSGTGILKIFPEYAYFHLLNIRDFKKQRRQRQRKRDLKYKFALLVLLRDYSNSFNLYNVAELFSNRKVGNGVQVETENEKINVMCSRSPQNLELLVISRWPSTAKKCTKTFNTRAGPLFLSLNPIVL